MKAFAGEDITALGTAGGSAFYRSALAGTYEAGRNISLRGISIARPGSILNGAEDLTLSAGSNIEINAFGQVESAGVGNVTLIVDQLFPVSPGIGLGEFDLSSMGTISGGGTVRIFTARREQNIVLGTGNLNGATFVPGPLLVDTSTEQWAAYYPSDLGGTPFTIFYKEGTVIPEPVGPTALALEILSLNPDAFIPFYELAYLLEGYHQDPVFAWAYTLPIQNKWCEKGGKETFCQTDVLDIKKLPPYIHRTAPKSF